MLANLNSLSIERGRASGPGEVLEYRMGFASDPVEVPEQGERHVPFVAIGAGVATPPPATTGATPLRRSRANLNSLSIERGRASRPARVSNGVCQ